MGGGTTGGDGVCGTGGTSTSGGIERCRGSSSSGSFGYGASTPTAGGGGKLDAIIFLVTKLIILMT